MLGTLTVHNFLQHLSGRHVLTTQEHLGVNSGPSQGSQCGANPGRQLGACSGLPLGQNPEACYKKSKTCFWAAAAPQLPSTLAMGAPLSAIIMLNSPEGDQARSSLHCIPLSVTPLGCKSTGVCRLCLPCSPPRLPVRPNRLIPTSKLYTSS